jgi:hypothetical protein
MAKLKITGLDHSLGMREIEYEGDDVNFLQAFASVGQMHQAAIAASLQRGITPLGYVLQQPSQLALPAAPSYPALPAASYPAVAYSPPAHQTVVYEQPCYPDFYQEPQTDVVYPTAIHPQPMKNGRNYLGTLGAAFLSAIAIGMVVWLVYPAFTKSMPKMSVAESSPQPSAKPSPTSKGVGSKPSAKKSPAKSSQGKSSTCLTLRNLFWVAPIAIGGAEGTRRPDGGKNPAYHGHVDPGNGVWNLGSFSWQHGASSPEEADRRQMKRLFRQAVELEERSVRAGLKLSVEEILNGADLANQAPLAALSGDGAAYMDRLKQAKVKGLTGIAAIVDARAKSYINGSGRLNAPGLGNSMSAVYRDQERRTIAIRTALEFNKQSLLKAGGPCETN